MGSRTQIVWWRRGAALAAGALAAAAVVAAVLLATGAGGSSGDYMVRAIFDDAGNLIPGENVESRGVKIGVVGEVVPTPNARAAVTLKIENPGFQDFRADASCAIKLQSLIGEKYVDCLPTQPRAEGAPLPPPAQKIPSGQEGAGQLLVPVEHTSSPIDIDLLSDINRLPESQRFAIIINELGAGFAGRGSDLNEVLQRSNPALREFNKVLGILASENKVLAKLAVDSNAALAPLAKVRGRVADFITQANTVSKAQANQRGALAEDLAGLPILLRELTPALRRVGQFAQQTQPVFEDLSVAAPGINRTFESLGPFSKSSTTFFENFGKTGKVTGPALVEARSFFSRFKGLGAEAKPFANNAGALLTSLRETGGIERLVDAIFNIAGATNGYDALGHFLRGELVVNQCETYVVVPSSGCGAKFTPSSSTAQSAKVVADASSVNNDVVMQRTLAVLRGETPAQAIAQYPGAAEGAAPGATPSGATQAPTTAQPVGGSSAGTTYYTPSNAGSTAGGLLLNYLLGE